MIKTKEILSSQEQKTISQSAKHIRALNHPLRQRIINHLERKGRVCVTDIYVKFRIEQSVASQQLAVLRGAGMVKTEREGKTIYYSPNYERISRTLSLMEQLNDVS